MRSSSLNGTDIFFFLNMFFLAALWLHRNIQQFVMMPLQKKLLSYLIRNLNGQQGNKNKMFFLLSEYTILHLTDTEVNPPRMWEVLRGESPLHMTLLLCWEPLVVLGLLSGCTNRNTNQSRTVKDRSGNPVLGHVTQSLGLQFPLYVCWEWIWGVFGGWGCASGLPSIFTHDQVRTKE